VLVSGTLSGEALAVVVPAVATENGGLVPVAIMMEPVVAHMTDM